MAVKPMGILFYIWVGIFNYFVIAQFWGFANDLYSDEAGKRTFPLVALGATLGGLIATLPFMRRLRDILGGSWEFKLMLIAGIVLFLCIVLARTIHGRDVRRSRAERGEGPAGAGRKAPRPGTAPQGRRRLQAGLQEPLSPAHRGHDRPLQFRQRDRGVHHHRRDGQSIDRDDRGEGGRGPGPSGGEPAGEAPPPRRRSCRARPRARPSTTPS